MWILMWVLAGKLSEGRIMYFRSDGDLCFHTEHQRELNVCWMVFRPQCMQSNMNRNSEKRISMWQKHLFYCPNIIRIVQTPCRSNEMHIRCWHTQWWWWSLTRTLTNEQHTRIYFWHKLYFSRAAQFDTLIRCHCLQLRICLWTFRDGWGLSTGCSISIMFCTAGSPTQHGDLTEGSDKQELGIYMQMNKWRKRQEVKHRTVTQGRYLQNKTGNKKTN